MDSAELRRRAEVDLGCGPFGDGLEGTRPEDLIHELRLHRTELELQNDELRRVQHEIEESRDRFQELFELSPCGYLTLDVRGGIWEMNRAAERILRVSRHDLLQQPLAKMMSEADAECFHLHLRRAFALCDTQRSELRLMRNDGTSVPVLLDSTVPPKRSLCMTAMVDLTDKHNAQAELREMAERFRQLTDHIEDVFFIFEVSTKRVLYVSPAIEQLLGEPPPDPLSSAHPWIERIHPDDRGRLLAAIRTFMRGDPLDIELRLRRSDGHRTVHARAFFVAGEDRIAGIITDVTEEKLREAELRQAQKMEAVGGLAAGIAHDFNNLLMGVIGFANIVLRKLEPSSVMQQEVQRIIEIASRGTTLTQQLLDFTRKRPAHSEIIELDPVIADCRPLITTLVGEAIEVSIDCGAPGCRVRANAGEIEQILMNLASNARDAMPRGGLLEIKTLEATDPERIGGRWLLLIVRDNGIGMDDSIRQRVFEPFFTTKSVGEGTGLGLSTTFAIVRRMGGSISLESAVGVGTMFTIQLPVVPDTMETRLPDFTALDGRGTVLVVEDDPFVRASVGYYLESLGYRPLIAANAEQTMRIVNEYGSEIDVLLTDVMMPRRLGSDLAREVRAVLPLLSVVYMSAHPRDELVARGRIESEAPFLQKPFDQRGLARALRAIIPSA